MSPLHVDILLALKGASQFGLPVENLVADLRRGRHRTTVVPAVEMALRDLADLSFTTPFDTALGAKRWRITALGVSALTEEGLA